MNIEKKIQLANNKIKNLQIILEGAENSGDEVLYEETETQILNAIDKLNKLEEEKKIKIKIKISRR